MTKISNLKKGDKFIIKDGLNIPGTLVFLDKNSKYLVQIPTNSPIGWKFPFNSKIYDEYINSFKELFPGENIYNFCFSWFGEQTEVEEIKNNQIEDFVNKNQNKGENSMVGQVKESVKEGSNVDASRPESLSTYGIRVVENGFRLAIAKKIVQKTQDALIELLISDALKNKNKKSKKALEQAREFATAIMKGPAGYLLTGAAMGFIIKAATDFGGEYAEIMKHPEISKFAETIHTTTVMESGTFILDKFEDLVKPLLSQVMNETSNLRVVANELESGKIEVDDNSELEKEEHALKEHQALDEAKNSLVKKALSPN